ncbi:hypothetical protein EXIGLDRAFT_85366 [Exidia glandulosa HHB12029]|uniref:Uncharacterized protein n=1 Tax=Exidia glandulosa HHB12029 TaxID=1314781 RepID=A0A165HFS7_EXIGL|nr:hypothetical protein EXIGLDRAFT_85366 [Exidia glandulosa HHB12029]
MRIRFSVRHPHCVLPRHGTIILRPTVKKPSPDPFACSPCTYIDGHPSRALAGLPTPATSPTPTYFSPLLANSTSPPLPQESLRYPPPTRCTHICAMWTMARDLPPPHPPKHLI